MSPEHHDTDADHAGVYDGLAGGGDHGEESQWAFGADLSAESLLSLHDRDDPLAGVDTTVPDGVDPAGLAAYSLMLGDDALIYSHRLTEWSSRAPDLEDDIALSNIALDLLGQARLLLSRAAAADLSVVPALPEGSPVPPEDALAFFREESAFRHVRLVEAENGDFAATIARLLLFSCYRLALLERLRTSRDPVLAAVAAKGVTEVTYHRDYAGRWFLTLAQGTAESRRRLDAAMPLVWSLHDELFATHPVEERLARAGVGVDPAELEAEVDVVLAQVLSVAGVERPDVAQVGTVAGSRGRHGRHTESFGRMLAEMQVIARVHPEGRW